MRKLLSIISDQTGMAVMSYVIAVGVLVSSGWVALYNVSDEVKCSTDNFANAIISEQFPECVRTGGGDRGNFEGGGGSGGAGGDNTAVPELDFVDLTGVPVGSTQLSNQITFSSLSGPTSVSFDNDEGNAFLSTDGGSNWQKATTVDNGDSLELRVVASSASNTSVRPVIRVGEASEAWLVTTGDVGSSSLSFAFSPDSLSGLDPGTLVQSNVVELTDFEGPLLLTLDSDLSDAFVSVNSGELKREANVFPGDRIFLSVTAGPDFGQSYATIVDIDGITASFTVETRSIDNSPNFNILPVTDADPNSFGQSAPFIVSGFDSASITIDGAADDNGHVRVNGGDWVDVATITDGDTVEVRFMLGAGFSTTYQALVTVGAASQVFDVTTKDLDEEPDDFDFTDLIDQLADTDVQSETVVPSGFNSPINVFVTGPGSPEISVNGAPFNGTTQVFISPGDSIRLQDHTSPNSGTGFLTTVHVGDLLVDWFVKTEGSSDTPNDFPLADIEDVEPNSLEESASHALVGFDTGAISIDNGGELSLDGGSTWVTNAAISGGDTVKFRATSPATLGTTEIYTIEAGGLVKTWRVSTRPADRTPDAFTFVDDNPVGLNESIESNIITVTGIDDGTSISLSGSEGAPAYRINGGAYIDAGIDGLVNAGDTVQLRMVSSALTETTRTATITIGASADDWSITTFDNSPDAFIFSDETGVPQNALRQSQTIDTTGYTDPVDVTIVSVAGAPELSVDSATTWSTAETMGLSDDLTVRNISSMASGDTIITSVSLEDGTQVDWNLVTYDFIPDDLPSPANFLDLEPGDIFETDFVGPLAGFDETRVIIAGEGASLQRRRCFTPGDVGSCSGAVEDVIAPLIDNEPGEWQYRIKATIPDNNLKSDYGAVYNYQYDFGSILDAHNEYLTETFTLSTRALDQLPETDTNFVTVTARPWDGIIETSSLTPSGFDVDIPVSITAVGVGSGELTLDNGVSWSATGTLVEGGSLNLRAVTYAVNSATQTDFDYVLGDFNGTWSVVTVDYLPDLWSDNIDQSGLNPSSPFETAPITLSGFDAAEVRLPAGLDFAFRYCVPDCVTDPASFSVYMGTDNVVDPLAAGAGETQIKFRGTAPGTFGDTDNYIVEMGYVTDGSGQSISQPSFAISTRAQDTLPDGIDGTSLTTAINIEPGNIVEAVDTLALTGFDGPLSITISGDGSPEYSINGGAYTSAPGQVDEGDNVTVRASASLDSNALHSVSINIGDATVSWDVVSWDYIVDGFDFIDQTDVPQSTDISSGFVSLSGFFSSDVSMTNGEFRTRLCDPGCGAPTAFGSSDRLFAATANEIELRVQSPSAGGTTATASVNLGGPTSSIDVDFAVTTIIDEAPDGFDFSDQVNVEPGTLIDLGATTISGINTSVSVSVTNAEYSINGGAYTSAPGSAVEGDEISLRMTSSPDSEGIVTGSVNIGSSTDGFSITSWDYLPDSFNILDQTDVSEDTDIFSGFVPLIGFFKTQVDVDNGAVFRTRLCDPSCGTASAFAQSDFIDASTVNEIEVRLHSSPVGLGVVTATVTTGGATASVTDDVSVTTALDDTPVITSFPLTKTLSGNSLTQSSEESITDWNENGLALSVSGDPTAEFSIDGGTTWVTSTTLPNPPGPPASVILRAVSGIGGAEKTITFTAGTQSVNWTLDHDSVIPDPFDVPDVIEWKENFYYLGTQDISISGMEAFPATMTIVDTGASGLTDFGFSVNDGAFTTSAPIQNGDVIRFRAKLAHNVPTLSATFDIAVEGQVIDSFTVTLWNGILTLFSPGDETDLIEPMQDELSISGHDLMGGMAYEGGTDLLQLFRFWTLDYGWAQYKESTGTFDARYNDYLIGNEAVQMSELRVTWPAAAGPVPTGYAYNMLEGTNIIGGYHGLTGTSDGSAATSSYFNYLTVPDSSSQFMASKLFRYTNLPAPTTDIHVNSGGFVEGTDDIIQQVFANGEFRMLRHNLSTGGFVSDFTFNPTRAVLPTFASVAPRDAIRSRTVADIPNSGDLIFSFVSEVQQCGGLFCNSPPAHLEKHQFFFRYNEALDNFDWAVYFDETSRENESGDTMHAYAIYNDRLYWAIADELADSVVLMIVDMTDGSFIGAKEVDPNSLTSDAFVDTPMDIVASADGVFMTIKMGENYILMKLDHDGNYSGDAVYFDTSATQQNQVDGLLRLMDNYDGTLSRGVITRNIGPNQFMWSVFDPATFTFDFASGSEFNRVFDMPANGITVVDRSAASIGYGAFPKSELDNNLSSYWFATDPSDYFGIEVYQERHFDRRHHYAVGEIVDSEPNSDATPALFDIPDLTDQEPDTIAAMGSFTVTDIDVPVGISISNAEYQINGGGFKSTSDTVNDGDVIDVRMTVPGGSSQQVSGSITVSAQTDVFSVQSWDYLPDGLDVTDKADQPASTLVESDFTALVGFLETDITVTNGEFRTRLCNPGCDAPTVYAATGTVLSSTANEIQLRGASGPNAADEVTVSLTAGYNGNVVADDFVITTFDDKTPNPFSFDETIVNDFGVLTESDPVAIDGWNSPSISLSVSGHASAELSVDGGVTWTSSAVMETPPGAPQNVRLRALSGPDGTARIITLDVEGVTADWSLRVVNTVASGIVIPDSPRFVKDFYYLWKDMIIGSITQPVTLTSEKLAPIVTNSEFEFSVNRGAFASSVVVAAGDTLDIRARFTAPFDPATENHSQAFRILSDGTEVDQTILTYWNGSISTTAFTFSSGDNPQSYGNENGLPQALLSSGFQSQNNDFRFKSATPEHLWIAGLGQNGDVTISQYDSQVSNNDRFKLSDVEANGYGKQVGGQKYHPERIVETIDNKFLSSFFTGQTNSDISGWHGMFMQVDLSDNAIDVTDIKWYGFTNEIDPTVHINLRGIVPDSVDPDVVTLAFGLRDSGTRTGIARFNKATNALISEKRFEPENNSVFAAASSNSSVVPIDMIGIPGSQNAVVTLSVSTPLRNPMIVGYHYATEQIAWLRYFPNITMTNTGQVASIAQVHNGFYYGTFTHDNGSETELVILKIDTTTGIVTDKVHLNSSDVEGITGDLKATNLIVNDDGVYVLVSAAQDLFFVKMGHDLDPSFPALQGVSADIQSNDPNAIGGFLTIVNGTHYGDLDERLIFGRKLNGVDQSAVAIMDSETLDVDETNGVYTKLTVSPFTEVVSDQTGVAIDLSDPSDQTAVFFPFNIVKFDGTNATYDNRQNFFR